MQAADAASSRDVERSMTSTNIDYNVRPPGGPVRTTGKASSPSSAACPSAARRGVRQTC